MYGRKINCLISSCPGRGGDGATKPEPGNAITNAACQICDCSTKAARPIAQTLANILVQMPPHWRRSVTFDNGTEFAHHYRLHALGMETFFCDTHSPWQKGGVENAIGRLRRNLPRKTDLATLSPRRFAQLVQAYNNTPRKCLDYLTPAEVFHNQLLHFKCESIDCWLAG